MAIKRGNPPGMKHVRASIYNHYVRVDQPRSLIFVSGQVARDDDGNLVGGASMLEQTRQCLRNIEKSLHAAGASLSDVVWTTVFTTDMRELKEIFAAREELPADTPLNLWRAKNEFIRRRLELAAQPLPAQQLAAAQSALARDIEARVLGILGPAAMVSARKEILNWLPVR